MKKVLIGISGGIAAYKTAEITSQLMQAGCDVRVIMSTAATKFITPLTFEALTQKTVRTTLFPSSTQGEKEGIYPHLYPATEADLFLIAPTTANTLAKLAHGIGDNIITCSALSLKPTCKRLFAPAMNVQMWEQPIVQQNIQKINQLGWQQIGPEKGNLACGTEGFGRMSAPETIIKTILKQLHLI
jgi:phosphopantothenoylcysteine decarboxylase/phosphopantothenate--cysteine ligase